MMVLMLRLFFCSLVFSLATIAQAQVTLATAQAHAPRIEKALKENILGFWYPRCIDSRNGGYTINFGPTGEPKGPGTKGIVTQSRQIWLFSRMARGGYADSKEMLAAADHGYRFLKEKMWDKQHGGFYWEVDASGDKALKPRKHMYGQSFALYALSEYYMASKRKDVLEFATMFFNMLEAKSHDKLYGGYLESFERDWSPQQGSEPGYMGDPALKIMNTHLHMLESVTAYYQASKSPLARERLLELITIESNTVVRKGLVACTDKYDRNWTPRLEGNYARVSYGHDLENIWLLVDACKVAGVPVHPLIDMFKDLFAYSRKYGYDEKNGGFWSSGPFREAASDRDKSWWVQAEALVSALYMYKLTRDAQYLEVFDKTWRFTDKYQIDWKNGEWWSSVREDLVGRGDKANIWKAGYHQGRAMIECLELLRELK